MQWNKKFISLEGMMIFPIWKKKNAIYITPPPHLSQLSPVSISIAI